MPKGAKPGVNRFKNHQSCGQKYRLERIRNTVIPRLKTLIGKTSFTGKTGFCKVCADLYNEGLPVNEKKIGYRTLEQNNDYWQVIGELYFRFWDRDGTTDDQSQKLKGKLAIKQEKRLREQLEQILNENEALKAALRNHGADKTLTDIQATPEIDTEFRRKFDQTCRALNLVIKASDGMFEVDFEAVKIKCNFDALESEEGLVPRALAEPYVTWSKNKSDKTGGRS